MLTIRAPNSTPVSEDQEKECDFNAEWEVHAFFNMLMTPPLSALSATKRITTA